MSGYALAKKVGISQSHLREIETGEVASPRAELAIAIADALGADIRELFSKKNEGTV